MLETDRGTITDIAVYDSKGSAVLRSHNGPLARVNVSALKPGEYFLRMVCADGGIGVVRFVKR